MACDFCCYIHTTNTEVSTFLHMISRSESFLLPSLRILPWPVALTGSVTVLSVRHVRCAERHECRSCTDRHTHISAFSRLLASMATSARNKSAHHTLALINRRKIFWELVNSTQHGLLRSLYTEQLCGVQSGGGKKKRCHRSSRSIKANFYYSKKLNFFH
jgi:hypothetical protein